MGMRSEFVIRTYRPADAAQIAALFVNTIRVVNRRDYSQAQVEAWAPHDPGAVNHWAAMLGDGRRAAFVAAAGDQVLGFTDVEPDGHLDRLFVHHLHQRRGIATKLHEAAEAAARQFDAPKMFTEASITARPFFLRQGYADVRRQTVTIRGEDLTNFAMEKPLAET
jgi:GNAT superfamily N-acetyltransferase